MPQSNASLETSRPNNPPASAARTAPRVEKPEHPDPAGLARPSRVERRAAEAAARAPAPSDAPRSTLAEIFAEPSVPADADGPDESHADEADGSTIPDTIDALTKRLGLTHEQVYAIKVAMPGNAEPLSLGELKDRVGAVVDLEQRELQFDQRRQKMEGELLRGQTELRELLSMLPKGSVSKEIVDKMRTRHNATMTRERELTLDHIPDWQDESRMTQEVHGISEWLHDEYGFDRSFVTTIVDHRALKFVRDMFLRDQKIKTALKNVQTPPQRGQRPSQRGTSVQGRSASKPAGSESTRSRGQITQRDKLMAVLNK